MKLLILLFMFIFIVGSFQIAGAQTNREIKLSVNGQKAIDNKNLTVKFVSVLEDSRCAEGANCIWAGNAKVELKLKKKNGAWKTFELNTNLEKQEIEFGGYLVKITELTPTPKENVRINRNGYVATFSVNKL
jgi:hypothetical protein